MEPYYWSQHDRQAVGLEGWDLMAARHGQILTSAKDISQDSILQFNHIQFHVTSVTAVMATLLSRDSKLLEAQVEFA
jgi:hypothetical protein